ncbi:MAG: heterodisulfide reductase-related iron-sulfur binding cluster [Pyrobaculum sp.]
MSWIAVLRELLVFSLERYGLPLPVDPGICNKWRVGLDFEKETERVLYTSCMYQMAPLIKKATGLLERAARGGVWARLAEVGARTLGGVLLRPTPAEEVRMSMMLRSIYYLIKKSGIKLGVLEEEPYSGALLYELGFEEEFKRQAEVVYKTFKEAGVREVITVDPHTQYVLEHVYPKYGFDIKAVSYIDLVNIAKVRAKMSGFVIHDSCLYSRFLDRREKIRQILAAGRPVEDPYVTGVETSGCCGGPVESIRPELAKKVAADRARRLARLSDKVVVACPICFINLSDRLETYDLSEVIE